MKKEASVKTGNAAIELLEAMSEKEFKKAKKEIDGDHVREILAAAERVIFRGFGKRRGDKRAD